MIDSDDLSMNVSTCSSLLLNLSLSQITLYYLPCATEQELIECTKKTKDTIEKAVFRREQRQTKTKVFISCNYSNNDINQFRNLTLNLFQKLRKVEKMIQ